MTSLKTLIAIVFFGLPSICRATCTFYEGHSQKQIIISVPVTLSIPRDAIIGTTIFESPEFTFQGNASYKCTTAFTWGIKNNRGSESSSDLFPIGSSGLSWQWIYNGNSIKGFSNGRALNPGGYGYNDSRTVLRIIKTGNIEPGASIAAGIMGFVQVDATLLTLALQIDKTSSIVLQSCETPDLNVEMGEYNLSVFSEPGNFTRPKPFAIKLNNCPTGINKVSYSFFANPSTPASNPGLGIIELNKNSTAKGIALQILDSNLDPVQLDAKYTYSEYITHGGNFAIPFNARYIRTLPSGGSGQYDSGMSAGTANSEITFIMSYL